jgi:hypothetical protein
MEEGSSQDGSDQRVGHLPSRHPGAIPRSENHDGEQDDLDDDEPLPARALPPGGSRCHDAVRNGYGRPALQRRRLLNPVSRPWRTPLPGRRPG